MRLKEDMNTKMLLDMKNFFIFAVVLLLPWTRVHAMEMTAPPIEQPLLREGTLAFDLAETLKIGTPQNEVEAESMLGDVGIAPRNGWIMDYPVTPDIVGELRNSISEAAGSGKLTIDRDEALNTFDSVMAGYNMAVRPYTDGEKYGPSSEPSPSDSSAIDDYYSSTGPPLVTYYAPPRDYYYLYVWVPCPFWWSNLRFSGFFILRDFHRVIIVKKRTVIITNHFKHIKTHKVFRIDPVSRFNGRSFAGIGAPRAKTFIRTGVPESDKRIFNPEIERVERREGTSGRPSGGVRMRQ